MTDTPANPPPPARAASLEELNALSTEIVGLVRAGIPLERGLAALADSPGRIADLAANVAQRLERGESLAASVPVRDDDLGAAYRAIVAAGTRSGRLGEGLEAFVGVGRSILDFRRQLVLALIYPVIVLSLIYVFFLWFVGTMVPRWERLYGDFGLETPRIFRFGASVGHWLAAYWYVAPLLLVAFVVGTWIAGRSGRLGPLAWIPYTGRSLRELRIATYCDLLSLLVGQGVPLPEALVLAGRGSGDARLAAEADRLAAEAQQGTGFAEGVRTSTALPVFARWMLAAGGRAGGLAAASSQTASVYRRRAGRRIVWVQTLVPILLTAVVGGSAVLVYALMLWVPFLQLINGLS